MSQITQPGTRFVLAQSMMPVVRLSSGTMDNTTGSLSGLTALSFQPSGVTRVIAATSAGLVAGTTYYGVWSSTTAVQLYTDIGATTQVSGTTAGAYANSTSEMIAKTIAIPANCMGANGRLTVKATFQVTNNANSKTLRVRFGAAGSGTGGTTVCSTSSASTVNISILIDIGNRNATNIQIPSSSSMSGPFGSTAVALVPTAVDTTAASEINLCCTTAVATDLVVLEQFSVELVPWSTVN